MKAEIQDRIVINYLFPEFGNIEEQTIVKSIQNKMSFTKEEAEEIDLKQENDIFSWNKAIVKDIDFNDQEIEFLKKQIDRLDKEKKINQTLVNLCLKLKEE